jgi:hypothetical protein
MQVRAERLQRGGECLRYLDWAPDDCLEMICWKADVLRFFATPLRAERLGPFATIEPEPPLSSYTLVEDGNAGRIDAVPAPSRSLVNLELSGWSRAPFVLVVVDGVVAARIPTGGRRSVEENAGPASGWRLRIKVRGHSLVEAYAVIDAGHLAKLDGAVAL